ncbi:MAG: hypothetical protein MJ252_13790 [archaeon]|nr:hypothetical protein [archaeon]
MHFSMNNDDNPFAMGAPDPIDLNINPGRIQNPFANPRDDNPFADNDFNDLDFNAPDPFGNAGNFQFNVYGNQANNPFANLPQPQLSEIPKSKNYLCHWETIIPEAFKNKNDADDLLCIICQNVPNPDLALELNCCGHIFCEKCLWQWIKDHHNCPLCKTEVGTQNLLSRRLRDCNKIFYRRMKRIEIVCPFNCGWMGELETFDNHIVLCSNVERQCKYSKFGCKYKGKGEDLKEHEEKSDKTHLDLANKFFDEKNSIVKGKASVHNHMLKFEYKYRWECNGKFMLGGCRSKSEGPMTGPRFACEECGFNLCYLCFYYYMQK